MAESSFRCNQTGKCSEQNSRPSTAKPHVAFESWARRPSSLFSSAVDTALAATPVWRPSSLLKGTTDATAYVARPVWKPSALPKQAIVQQATSTDTKAVSTWDTPIVQTARRALPLEMCITSLLSQQAYVGDTNETAPVSVTSRSLSPSSPSQDRPTISLPEAPTTTSSTLARSASPDVPATSTPSAGATHTRSALPGSPVTRPGDYSSKATVESFVPFQPSASSPRGFVGLSGKPSVSGKATDKQPGSCNNSKRKAESDVDIEIDSKRVRNDRMLQADQRHLAQIKHSTNTITSSGAKECDSKATIESEIKSEHQACNAGDIAGKSAVVLASEHIHPARQAMLSQSARSLNAHTPMQESEDNLDLIPSGQDSATAANRAPLGVRSRPSAHTYIPSTDHQARISKTDQPVLKHQRQRSSLDPGETRSINEQRPSPKFVEECTPLPRPVSSVTDRLGADETEEYLKLAVRQALKNLPGWFISQAFTAGISISNADHDAVTRLIKTRTSVIPDTVYRKFIRKVNRAMNAKK